LWALALAVVVLTIASWVAFSTESASTDDPDVVRLDPNIVFEPSGLNAPDVSGRAVSTAAYTTFDGTTSDLGAYRGRPLVVNFWRSDCAPCIREMPALERVHRAAGDQVAFVGLTVQDREDDARELADRTGVGYDLGFDATGQLIADLGGINLPTTVFVNADGVIVDTHAGEVTEDELRGMIRTNLGVEVPVGS
jgi:thiol-disulfide isomerase/thioredoxin